MAARTDQSKVLEQGIDDRLSTLPDELIAHILSLLPTKYAVGTAVLSRRWTDLWTRVSNLDFDVHLSYKQLGTYHGGDSPAQAAFRARQDLEFFRFVYRVLSQHRNLNSVRRFRLHFLLFRLNWGSTLDGLLERKLLFGSQVEEIDVSIVGAVTYGHPGLIWWLPEGFYTLKNLKVMKLHSVLMSAQGSVSLPSLKILQLQRVIVWDSESLGRLISGCPVLETLDLECCYLDNSNEKNIRIACLSSLRNLRIVDDLDVKHLFCHIAIEAPILEHLVLLGFVDLTFLGGRSLPCLYSAEIHIDDTGGGSYQCLIRLLTQITNTKKMFLHDDTLEVLSAGNDVRRLVFPNLTHLTLQPTERCCSWILHSLLHSVPKLQSLVINPRIAEGPMIWEETEPRPQCLKSSLEEIEIKGFAPLENDMKMVGYLLNVGAVLRKVVIHVSKDDNTERERKGLQTLLKLPRESSACDIRLLLCDREMDINIDDDDDDINTDN